MQKDYRVHTPVVKELLKSQYDCLLDLKCVDLSKSEVQKGFKELKTVMREYYKKIRKSVKETEVQKDVYG